MIYKMCYHTLKSYIFNGATWHLLVIIFRTHYKHEGMVPPIYAFYWIFLLMYFIFMDIPLLLLVLFLITTNLAN